MNPSRTGFQIAKSFAKRTSVPNSPSSISEEKNANVETSSKTPLQKSPTVSVQLSLLFDCAASNGAQHPPLYAFNITSYVVVPAKGVVGYDPVTFDHVGYATMTVEESDGRLFDVRMSFDELYDAIKNHLDRFDTCRLGWGNRLLSKANTVEEFERALEIVTLFQQRNIESSPETGTLLIKAACRAGVPERALELLQAKSQYRLFPTIGGVHYLMVNFCLKKDTASVMKTFEATKERGFTPNTRTYQILIRECVDSDNIEDALKIAEEAKKNNIMPNRVTYNILMNGCRKFNKPEGILQLRAQMDAEQVEINDTTVKFTTLAHMMLGATREAVSSFLNYPELKTKLQEFCDKFWEVEEDQLPLVQQLFQTLKSEGVTLPESTLARVQ